MLDSFTLPPDHASAIPTVHVLITVTGFRDLLQPLEDNSGLTRHEVKLLTRHPNVSLDDKNRDKRITLHVRNEGAILRFIIRDKNPLRIYRPMAITFQRIGEKRPAAVYCSAGNQTGVYTPFSSLQLNGSTLQITDTLAPGRGPKRQVRYKFSIVIQENNSGEIGVVDPDISNDYLENDNET
jgi:hypothetical protein